MCESVGQQSGDIMKTERTELHQLAEKNIDICRIMHFITNLFRK